MENFLNENEKILLTEMLSRTKKTSNNYYKSFNSNESICLRKIHSKCLYNDIFNVETLYTKTGIIVSRNKNFNNIVIGDYGAFFEFDNTDIECKITQKFEGAPKRNIKYIWMETEDNTKVYKQISAVNYTDYKPGKYYMAAEDLYFKIYKNLMPLSVIGLEIEKIEKENDFINIKIEKEQAEEVILSLSMRINFIETGNIMYSTEDVLRMSDKFKEMYNLKIKNLTDEQRKITEQLKKIKQQIIEEYN